MTDEQMQICEFHYRGTCTIHREPEIEKCRKDGAVFAEIVVDADPCNRELCPFQGNNQKNKRKWDNTKSTLELD